MAVRAALSLKELSVRRTPIGKYRGIWYGVQKFAVCDSHVNRMQRSAKQAHSKSEPRDAREHAEESFRRLRSRFSRRLESFGLGESQLPLLTDCVDSLDAEGNAR